MLPMKAGLPAKALRLVPYLTPAEVTQLCGGCRGRHQERDALLIMLLFQTGLQDLRGPEPHRGAPQPAAGRSRDPGQGR